ncbi:luciferase-like domain-containing protein [Aspergillus carlsbadensis]|nr:luciferase-like domain-containing protein [Aspergillus carlsbadensis]
MPPKAEKPRIYINAFEMITPSHQSFGQWKRPEDKGLTKGRNLAYWTNLAQLLEKGGVTSLFLADAYSQNDMYKGNASTAVRTACQFPIADPVVPISAMAAVTKRLTFAITASTSFEAPYVLAKRFSTLDNMTDGRFGWNIVTSTKKSAFDAVGIPLVAHDTRYEVADEYMEVVYKIWEGSWADDALKEHEETGVFADPARIRTIEHKGPHFNVRGMHIVEPSPQRTPFLFQAGTSPAGIAFAARHAEGTFVSGLSAHIIAPRVAAIRAEAAKLGRDPQSIKVFAMMTPIVGQTDEEAQEKYKRALAYADEEAGLALFSSNAGIDLSKYDLDTRITPDDITIDDRVHSMVNSLSYRGDDLPAWTPRNIGKQLALGGNAPLPIGSAATVADFLEGFMAVADVDGFNMCHVTTPGSYEDLVELLIPELRRRGRYPVVDDPGERGTLREQIYGRGQSRLRSDHVGSTWKYDCYPEDK